MNKQTKFSDQKINNFLSQADVPLGKDKAQPVTISLFNLNWRYGIAASIAILIAVTIYLNPLENMQNRMAFGELSATEEELFADETMIESLFIEDSEFDDWFEERYVLNVVN